MKELIPERIAELLNAKGEGTWGVGIWPAMDPDYVQVYAVCPEKNQMGKTLISRRTLKNITEDMLAAVLFHATKTQALNSHDLVIDDLGDMK